VTITVDDARTIETLRVELAAAQARLAELERMALTDPLTGLWNRAAMEATLAAYGAGLGGFAAIVIDLDRFKPINDTYGHAAGDEVLVTVAARLRDLVVDSGVAVRLGGDEFAALAPSPSPETSRLLALDVAEVLAEPVSICGEQITVGASIGVVHAWPSEAGRALSAADWAMYRAKFAGGGVVEHDPLLAPIAVEPRPALRLRDLRVQQRREMSEGVRAA
jgi:diguanylate cyclase (GGDEF)-like protein